VADVFDLTGTVAVVTGSTRGIGRQTALALGQAGASVVLVGRASDASPNPVMAGTLESVAAELAALGIDVCGVQADLTDPEATARVVDETLAWRGRCDVLVNNAAYTSNGPILEVPAKRWSKGFSAQVVAPLQLAQGLVGGMLERGSGRVVNVSSGSSTALSPGLALYSVTKQAMERLTDYLLLELGGRGVSFNALRIDRVVTTETWLYIRDTQGEDIATMGGSVTESMTPPEIAAQLLWMIRQPDDWSGHVVGCAEVEALGGPARVS
jgi:NAD(P)-dependent dehydrogenase (short-subunit alcohol dehydrogenase family)